jgi:hypothetical protein
MENKERMIYTDLESVIDLFEADDLPKEEMAFPYYKGEVDREGVKLITWIHRSELENYKVLRSTYNNSMLRRR